MKYFSYYPFLHYVFLSAPLYIFLSSYFSFPKFYYFWVFWCFPFFSHFSDGSYSSPLLSCSFTVGVHLPRNNSWGLLFLSPLLVLIYTHSLDYLLQSPDFKLHLSVMTFQFSVPDLNSLCAIDLHVWFPPWHLHLVIK